MCHLHQRSHTTARASIRKCSWYKYIGSCDLIPGKLLESKNVQSLEAFPLSFPRAD